MQIKHIFTTPIAEEFLTGIDNAAIEQYCKYAVNRTRETKIDYVEGQSAFLDLTSDPMYTLASKITTLANVFYRSLGFDERSRLRIMQAWCSTNNTESIDKPHVHVQSAFAAVYYVKAFGPSSGPLNLLTTQSVVQHKLEGRFVGRGHNGFNSAGWQIIPETGKLVLFPAWVVHMVSKNTTDQDRISIAFDIIVDHDPIEDPVLR